MSKQNKPAAVDPALLCVHREAVAERVAVEGFTSAASVVGPVVRGLELFALTRGQIGLVDLVSYVLDQTGGGSVSVWTWAVSDAETIAFEWFMRSPLVRGGVLVVDNGTAQRNPALVARWVDRFGPGTVRACRNHAKLSAIEAGELRIVCRGSMNLDQHEIIEQFDVPEDSRLFDYVRRVEESLDRVPSDSLSAENDSQPRAGDLNDSQLPAGSAGRPFQLAGLRQLSGIRPWAK